MTEDPVDIPDRDVDASYRLSQRDMLDCDDFRILMDREKRISVGQFWDT
jgi:hypothetical protein